MAFIWHTSSAANPEAYITELQTLLQPICGLQSAGAWSDNYDYLYYRHYEGAYYSGTHPIFGSFVLYSIRHPYKEQSLQTSVSDTYGRLALRYLEGAYDETKLPTAQSYKLNYLNSAYYESICYGVKGELYGQETIIDTETGNFNCIIEVEKGSFRHFGIATSAATLTSAYNHRYGSYCSDISTSTAMHPFGSSAYANARFNTDYFGNVGQYFQHTTRTYYSVSTTCITGAFNNAFLGNAYISEENGVAPLRPIQLGLNWADGYWMMPEVSNIKGITITYIEPGEELAYGNNTWKIYPTIRKRLPSDPSVTNDLSSGVDGLAYLVSST